MTTDIRYPDERRECNFARIVRGYFGISLKEIQESIQNFSQEISANTKISPTKFQPRFSKFAQEIQPKKSANTPKNPQTESACRPNKSQALNGDQRSCGVMGDVVSTDGNDATTPTAPTKPIGPDSTTATY